jgi:5'(3')-deoxyribonucleotidase
VKLGLDIDGCLADWVGSTFREHARWFGTKLDPADVKQWADPVTMSGMSASELFAWCREAQVYEKADPIPGAFGGIRALAAAGHTIDFVTHRPEWCVEITWEWLQHWLGRTVPIVLDVVHVLQTVKSTVPCDIYLDDGPHVLEELTGQGLLAVRFEQPWNAELAPKHYAASVPSWRRFVEVVEALS